MSNINSKYMIIYKVTNNINNKIYIGQTKFSLEERKKRHWNDANTLNRKTVKFHNALLKYGLNNFIWEVIKECDNQEELDYYEKFYIALFNSTDPEIGYNLKLGGKFGGIFTEEAKRNLGESTKKKWENPEMASKMLEGLRKGTETCKLKAENNYIMHICPVCGAEFKTKNWNSHVYCSLECANMHLKDSLLEKSRLGVEKIKDQYKETKENRNNLIIEWVKNNTEIIIKAKLNNLTFLKDLALFIGVKDTRSLGKVLDVTYKKDILNKLKELVKIYAEQ